MSNQEKCSEYAELLDAYLDEELSADERQAVDEHLSGCNACLQELQATANLVGRLKTLSAKTLPSGEVDWSFLNEPQGSQTCESIVEMLDAYHDGELDSVEKLAVEEHLSGCAECNKCLADTVKVVGALQSLPRLTLPHDLAESLDLSCSEASASCSDTIKLLDGYNDRELAEAEVRQVESHLAQCSDCAARLLGIRKVVEALQSLPRLQPQRDIVDNLHFESSTNNSTAANVVSLSAHKSSKARFFSRPSRLQVGIIAAASAAVALLFCLNFKLAPGGSNANLAVRPASSGTATVNSDSTEGGNVVLPGAQIASRQSSAGTSGDPSGESLSSGEGSGENNNNNMEIAARKTEPETGNPRQTSADQKDRTGGSKKDAGASKQQFLPGVKTLIASAPGTNLNAAPAAKQETTSPANNNRSDETIKELAAIPDGGASASDALGIGTNEDGLYDIKI